MLSGASRIQRSGSNVTKKFDHANELIHAVKSGSQEAVVSLCEMGVDLDKKDNKQRAAIHYAVRENNLQALKTLLKFQVDPYVQDSRGRTAAHLAAKYQRDDMARRLAKAAPLVMAVKDNKQRLPIDYLESDSPLRPLFRVRQQKFGLLPWEVPVAHRTLSFTSLKRKVSPRRQTIEAENLEQAHMDQVDCLATEITECLNDKFKPFTYRSQRIDVHKAELDSSSIIQVRVFGRMTADGRYSVVNFEEIANTLLGLSKWLTPYQMLKVIADNYKELHDSQCIAALFFVKEMISIHRFEHELKSRKFKNKLTTLMGEVKSNEGLSVVADMILSLYKKVVDYSPVEVDRANSMADQYLNFEILIGQIANGQLDKAQTAIAAELVANDMLTFVLHGYTSISSQHWLNATKPIEHDARTQQFVRHQNIVSGMVIYDILSAPKTGRIPVFQFYLEVAHQSFKLGDLDSFLQLMSAFDNNCLNHIILKNALDGPSKAILDKLIPKVNLSRNFKALRSLAAGTLPASAMLHSDIIHAMDVADPLAKLDAHVPIAKTLVRAKYVSFVSGHAKVFRTNLIDRVAKIEDYVNEEQLFNLKEQVLQEDCSSLSTAEMIQLLEQDEKLNISQVQGMDFQAVRRLELTCKKLRDFERRQLPKAIRRSELYTGDDTDEAQLIHALETLKLKGPADNSKYAAELEKLGELQHFQAAISDYVTRHNMPLIYSFAHEPFNNQTPDITSSPKLSRANKHKRQ